MHVARPGTARVRPGRCSNYWNHQVAYHQIQCRLMGVYSPMQQLRYHQGACHQLQCQMMGMCQNRLAWSTCQFEQIHFQIAYHDNTMARLQYQLHAQTHFAVISYVHPDVTIQDLKDVLARIDFVAISIVKCPAVGEFRVQFAEHYAAVSFELALDRVDPRRQMLAPAGGQEIRVLHV